MLKIQTQIAININLILGLIFFGYQLRNTSFNSFLKPPLLSLSFSPLLLPWEHLGHGTVRFGGRIVFIGKNGLLHCTYELLQISYRV